MSSARDALLGALEGAFGLDSLPPTATDEDVVSAILAVIWSQQPPAPPAPPPPPQQPAALRAQLDECRRKRDEYHGIAIRERAARVDAERNERMMLNQTGGANGLIEQAEAARDAAVRAARESERAAKSVPRLARRAVGSRQHIKKALRHVHPDKRRGAQCASCGPTLDAVSRELTSALSLCTAIREVVGDATWSEAQRALAQR